MSLVTLLFEQLRNTAVEIQQDSEALYDASVSRSNPVPFSKSEEEHLCAQFLSSLHSQVARIQQQIFAMTTLAKNSPSCEELLQKSQHLLSENAAKISQLEEFLLRYGYKAPLFTDCTKDATCFPTESDEKENTVDSFNANCTFTESKEPSSIIKDSKDCTAEHECEQNMMEQNVFSEDPKTPKSVRKSRFEEPILPETPNTPTLEEFGLSKATIHAALRGPSDMLLSPDEDGESPMDSLYFTSIKSSVGSQRHAMYSSGNRVSNGSVSSGMESTPEVGFQGLTGDYRGLCTPSPLPYRPNMDSISTGNGVSQETADKVEEKSEDTVKFMISREEYESLALFIRAQTTSEALQDAYQRFGSYCLKEHAYWITQQHATELIGLDGSKAKAVILALTQLKRIRFEKQNGNVGYILITNIPA
uniref:Spindle and kinetochore-associated protein 3 n=1 Tax=Timspurckia oligopyrenoides TaxID=708627 RepID=A0A7S0ZJR9_9RHOD|mmetsp:Transcript_7716/g.14015  ORF Transcript_7716/g.14015 Transcript_7716/m.14015 type:complete len:419 (+) Transcript_7716:56-1312(+)